MTHTHIIKNVLPGSIAEELEISAGDKLLAINDQEIEDVFDYHFLANEEYLTVLIEKPDGEQWELEIEKEYEEDLGIEFEQGLMDEYRSCRNKCIFCFIDQMPKDMRETLYFKDDDSRLSFLQGNYVTLTNMSDHDIDRIVRYHLEPINVSFQTTNPELRCKMLHNRYTLKLWCILHQIPNASLQLFSVVNSFTEYDLTIHRNAALIQPVHLVQCLSRKTVVPVGLSKYRDGLYPLQPFTKEDAKEVLHIIHKWQKKAYEEFGIHFIHGGDEWYILAEEELPEEERYDGYLQLENGVGMLRLLMNEFEDGYESLNGDEIDREVSVATGFLAYPYIKRMADRIMEKYPKSKLHVYGIRNDFFGELITVSGLITGQDLIGQLKGKALGEKLLLPCNMLRIEEQDFLDDVTLQDVKDALQVPVDIVKSSGQDFIDAVLG